jgi:hypothetical protein
LKDIPSLSISYQESLDHKNDITAFVLQKHNAVLKKFIKPQEPIKQKRSPKNTEQFREKVSCMKLEEISYDLIKPYQETMDIDGNTILDLEKVIDDCIKSKEKYHEAHKMNVSMQ